MRIVTWNCCGGACLDRAAELAPLAPDLAVLQECAQPHAGAAENEWLWFGENPRKGVGVVAGAGWRVERGPVDETVRHTAFPVVVTRTSGGPPVHLLAIWSFREPTYVEAIRSGLDAYAGFLRAAPGVVVGDFNSSPDFAPKTGPRSHGALVAHLHDAFGLASAWHAHAAARGRSPLDETPTLYFRWQERRPFHIDYCFVPAAWVPAIRDVRVGSFAEWEGRSDHRPLLVDVDADATSGAPDA